MRFLIGLVRLGFTLGVLVAAILAVLGAFGFLSRALDVVNHVQPLLLAGLVMALLLVPLILPAGLGRVTMLGLCAAGLLASAFIVLPEVIATYSPRPPVPAGRQVVKLMTHNLFGRNYDMARVAEVIAKENPDIVALQEYFGEQRTELYPLLRDSYPYSVHCQGGKRANIGLYSKIPFAQSMDGACPDNAYVTDRTAHIIGKFELPDGTSFSVMTTHLDWPAPKVERQENQFAQLVQVANGVNGPLLVVGDFNSTPWSYALRGFADEAHLTRQTHANFTYPTLFAFDKWRETPPFLPLDQVMTRGNIEVHELHVGEKTGSDHLPVIVSFTVGPESVAATP
jgi:endonuclease/exonuclease/phosphatase (EEP) superfamily protein YafD